MPCSRRLWLRCKPLPNLSSLTRLARQGGDRVWDLLAFVLAELRRPEDFRSWYAWATNQAGHMFIGYGAGAALAWVWRPSWFVPFAVAFFYALLWEITAQGDNGTAADNTLDTSFVGAGAVLFIAAGNSAGMAFGLWCAAALALIVGIFARL